MFPTTYDKFGRTHALVSAAPGLDCATAARMVAGRMQDGRVLGSARSVSGSCFAVHVEGGRAPIITTVDRADEILLMTLEEFEGFYACVEQHVAYSSHSTFSFPVSNDRFGGVFSVVPVVPGITLARAAVLVEAAGRGDLRADGARMGIGGKHVFVETFKTNGVVLQPTVNLSDEIPMGDNDFNRMLDHATHHGGGEIQRLCDEFPDFKQKFEEIMEGVHPDRSGLFLDLA